MSTLATFQSIRSFEVETCCNCGVEFGMPSEVNRRRHQDGGSFYCPNGHSQHYTQSEVQKLQKQLDEAKRDAEWQRQLRDKADKSLIAQRGENTKLRKRIANGVCPCCKRSFSNLHRHMEQQHPDFAASEVKGASR